MGELRDWRQSFRELEQDRLKDQPVPARIEPVFPPDIVIPPPLGAAIVAIPLLPAPEPLVEQAPARPRRAGQRKTAAKRTRKPAVKKRPRKAAATKPRKAATARRTAKEVPAPSPAEPAQLSAAPALPAPPQPLPPPLAPLPRRSAPVPYRKGGLAEAIGYWLRTVARGARGPFSARPVAPSAPAAEAELARLRSENESLRRQLEALAALREGAEIKLPG